MRFRKNERGISMISMMVAFAMAGVLAVVVMKLSDNMQGVQQKGSSSVDASELLYEMRLILADDKNCRLSLAGENPALTPVKFRKEAIDDPATDQGLPFEIFIGNTTGTNRLVKKFSATDPATKTFGKINIDGIRLFMNTGTGFNYAPTDTSDLGVIRLDYSYLMNKTTMRYHKDLLVRVGFTTDTLGESTIQGCAQNGSTLSFQTVCESFPGHVWDSGSSECKSPNEFTRLLAIKLEYNGTTWVVKGTNVLQTENEADKTLSAVIDNVAKSGDRFKIRISFDGGFLDSTEILTAQYISRSNGNLKLTLNNSDGNNLLEFVLSDDSSDNSFNTGDQIFIIHASPRIF